MYGYIFTGKFAVSFLSLDCVIQLMYKKIIRVTFRNMPSVLLPFDYLYVPVI